MSTADSWQLGATVPLRFEVRDDEGELVNPTAWAVSIVDPAGTATDQTSSVDNTEVGQFDLDYTPAVAGTHVAIFTATGEYAGMSTDVFLVTATSAQLAEITPLQLRTYLGDPTEVDATLADALTAERSAQADVCRVDPFTPALRESLLRRVARNLAARSVPVAQFSTFEGGATSTRVPVNDPEIARLEKPRRRHPIA